MTDSVVYRTKIARDGSVLLDEGGDKQFPWWSVTKAVLAACALRLVDQGRLNLHDPLPDRPYSLRQLLQHRAGVPNYGGLAAYHEAVARGDTPWTVTDLLEKTEAANLVFPPDKGWRYSNVGYLFVRQIVEQAADADIETAIRRLVFDPMKLPSARLVAHPDDLETTAWGNADRYHPGWVYHGLLVGTALDAARFMDGLIGGRLLPPDLLQVMTTAHRLGGPIPDRPWQTTGYGLGLMIGEMEGAGLAIGHSGAGPGSVNAVYHFPECRPPVTVAAFTQAEDEGVTEHAAARLARE